jgi:hypothetical protein
MTATYVLVAKHLQKDPAPPIGPFSSFKSAYDWLYSKHQRKIYAGRYTIQKLHKPKVLELPDPKFSILTENGPIEINFTWSSWEKVKHTSNKANHIPQ